MIDFYVPWDRPMHGPLPDLTVTNWFSAGRILKDPNLRHGLQWVISMGGRTPDGFDHISDKRKLRLIFDDIDHTRPPWVAPTMADIEAITRLSREAGDDKILIHCAAGQSRSTATALIVLADRLGPGRELEAVEALVEMVHDAEEKGLRPPGTPIHPNRLMVYQGDQHLERGGKLWSALLHRSSGQYEKGFIPPW